MEILSNLKITPKIVLKVQFLGEYSTRIELMLVNKEYIKKLGTNDFQYYRNGTYDFILWSTQNFIFDKRQIRLPDEMNLMKNMSHVHIFRNNKERYDTLKNMYKTLERWSIHVDSIRGIKPIYDKKVKLDGEFWYVS